ncbi:MAG: hypothetical protein ABWK15_08390 [Dissulfuribacterales bacterium]
MTALTEKFGQNAQRLAKKITAIESCERLTYLLKKVIWAGLLTEIKKELEK